MNHELQERIAGEIAMSTRPGEAIRKWRQEFRVSVKELSGEMKVTASVVSDYESGRRRPGVDLVRRTVEALLAVDAATGRNLAARFLPLASAAIPAMGEFPAPIGAVDFLRRIGGKMLTRIPATRSLKGYTVIDSVRAITDLAATDYHRIFGHSTERALVFTGVKYGRSPMAVIRTHPLKPAMVVYSRPEQVDALAVQLAELENILLATCGLQPATLLDRLEKMA